jgi:hypothetical protein
MTSNRSLKVATSQRLIDHRLPVHIQSSTSSAESGRRANSKWRTTLRGKDDARSAAIVRATSYTTRLRVTLSPSNAA